MVRLIWSFEYTSSYIEVSVLLRKKVRGSPLGTKGLEAEPNLMFVIVNTKACMRSPHHCINFEYIRTLGFALLTRVLKTSMTLLLQVCLDF